MKLANNITRAIHMAGLRLRVRSPEILVMTGVVGAVVGTVMACKATLKLDDILAEAGETIERVNETETGTFPRASDPSETIRYTEDDKKKDIVIVYVKTGVRVAKLYAPAAVVTGLSIAAILTGHNLLRKRNLALAAAYTAVDSGFRKYRKGVVDKFGEAIDWELGGGVKALEVTETVTDEKTGEPKEVKKTVEAVSGSDLPSPYAKIFKEGGRGWKNNPDYNRMFLEAQQNGANDLLRARGYLFLNEVYDMLGFEPTKAGQIVGWIYDKKKPSGDNFVDFGIHEVCDTHNSDYEEDWDWGYLLDFNVDGNILDKI